MVRARNGLFYLFLLVVMLAPLPLGSNREWSWTLLAFLVSIIALTWAILSAFDSNKITKGPNPALVIGFLLVCCWAWIQAGTLVPADWNHPLYQMSNGFVGAISIANSSTGSISLAPDDTYTAFMRLLAYGLVFILAFQWGKDPRLAGRALYWMVLAGMAYSIYGLAMFWGDTGRLFWFESPGFNHSVRGTFVNRNHFATYAGLMLLCAIALFYQKVAVQGAGHHSMPAPRRIPRGARVATRLERLERFALEVWRPLIVILMLSTALILTNSRGGFISTLIGGIVLFLCFNFRRRFRSRRSLAVIVLAGGFAIVAFWLTSEILLQRIDKTELEDNTRLIAYNVISESTGDNPALGFGYGTFASSFRLYRPDTLDTYFDRAHNTYLENAFELGWPAAILLFMTIGACGLVCIRGLRERGRDWVYPAIGIAATVLVAVHALFDFSLQMPGVAITYACILGLACAQSYSSRIT